MIFTALGFLIMFYALSNYKRAFCIFVIFDAFLNTNIALISVPGVPQLSLELSMTLFFTVLYFIKIPKSRRASVRPFPLATPFILLAISWFLSSVFAIIGFSSAISQCIGESVVQLVLPWLIWAVVERDKEFRLLFLGISAVFLFATIYGLFESLTSSNPLMDYEVTLNGDPEKALDFSSDDKTRGWRIKSIFLMSIGAGMNFMLYALFIILLRYGRDKNLKVGPLHIIIAVLCLICAFLTKSRSPFFFFFVALCSLINPKKKQFWIYAVAAGVAVLAILPILGKSDFNVLSSLFNAEARNDAGGSSGEMRLEQLAAAFLLLRSSFVFGLGPKFASAAFVNQDLVHSLLGSESIWFKVMPQYGLVGVVAYVYLIYVSVFRIPKYYGSKEVLWLNLSYWLTYTISSLPGMYMPFFYIIFFYWLKHTPRYQLSSSVKTKRRRKRIMGKMPSISSSI